MTTTTERNRLGQLAAKIRDLPVQDALKRRRQLYGNATAEAQACRQELDTALNQVRALRTIRADPDRLSESERKRRSTARLRSEDLQQLLDGRDVDQARISEKFENIKRSTRGLLSEAKADWVELCQAHQERASLFRALAEQIDLAAAQRIGVLARQLQPDAAPPTSLEAVQAALQTRLDLSAEIERMNTNGPIEQFLRDALARRGDPRALFDPVVREYLDAHPSIWTSLRVSLE